MTETDLKLLLNEKISDIADALMFYYDCCGIRGSECKAGNPNPCCTGRTKFGNGCPFWKGKCTFRNADCKLWLCQTAIDSTDQKCISALKLLSEFSLLFDIATNPIIGKPYCGGDKQPT